MLLYRVRDDPNYDDTNMGIMWKGRELCVVALLTAKTGRERIKGNEGRDRKMLRSIRKCTNESDRLTTVTEKTMKGN